MDVNTNMAAYLYARGVIKEEASIEDAFCFAAEVNACIDNLIEDLRAIEDLKLISEEELQGLFYEAGKLYFSTQLRTWFRILYEIMFKEDNGPRIGQFVRIVGVDWILDKLYAVRINPYSV